MSSHRTSVPTAASSPTTKVSKAARREERPHNYLYETHRRAPACPFIQTLRDLRETGDESRAFEGIFSGTLAVILFNVYDGTTPFLGHRA